MKVPSSKFQIPGSSKLQVPISCGLRFEIWNLEFPGTWNLELGTLAVSSE
jgi:hypothetical protein